MTPPNATSSYWTYLKRAAMGIPLAPFSPWLWEGFGGALKQLFDTLWTLLQCLFMLATYPVSVFFLAEIARRGNAQIDAAWKRHPEYDEGESL